MSRILIIDDDVALCRSLRIQLAAEGHEVALSHSAKEAAKQSEGGTSDLVLLDLGLPDANGLDVLRRLLADAPEASVVMITGQHDTKATIDAMRSGAFDYIRKPFVLDDILLALEKAKRRGRAGKPAVEMSPAAKREIVGADRQIDAMVKQIGLLARTQVTVLIEGESGTGKELVARALHEAGSPGEPFVAVNCSAVVPGLLESEMFGHEKGAFTGADQRRAGKLELAGRGTLFLDEIGDMTLELQAKLLRVLQEREFERVGGAQTIPFHARVVAATHRDLAERVREGKFREDLLYRLAVSRLVVPPLRARRGDIRLLVRHLLARIASELHRNVSGVDEPAMRKLEAYDWPGNVRELQNVLTRAAALARGSLLTAEDLEFSFRPATGGPAGDGKVVTLRDAERTHIARVLQDHGGNITHTARALDISPTTLRKKITDYGLRAEDPTA